MNFICYNHSASPIAQVNGIRYDIPEYTDIRDNHRHPAHDPVLFPPLVLPTATSLFPQHSVSSVFGSPS